MKYPNNNYYCNKRKKSMKIYINIHATDGCQVKEYTKRKEKIK